MKGFAFTGVALFWPGSPVFLHPRHWPAWAFGPCAHTPLRIWLRRAKGWRIPPNTTVVSRPRPHGNPYYPGCGIGFGGFDENMRPVHWALETNADAVRHYSEYMRLMKKDDPRYPEYISPLRGKNLACWCRLCPEHQDGRPLGVTCDACEPCHVDILLPMANGDRQ